MMQTMAWVFGLVLLAVGALGFVPGAVTGGGLLLGIFMVDTMHSVIHLITGALALGASMGKGSYARAYFRVFGFVYALMALAGFLVQGSVLGMMMNLSDNLLHVVIAATAFYAGFGMKDAPTHINLPMKVTA